MSEQLLSISEVAERLGISLRQLYRVLPCMVAKGLQPVRIGRQKRYREASLDRLIRNAAEKDTPLVSIGVSGIGGECPKEL